MKFESLIEVVPGSTRANQLSAKYSNSAFSANNALQSITYKNFGVETRAAGDLNGTEISGVTTATWDAKIKGNAKLWTTIATVMNSLGYDAELNTKANETGFAGVKGTASAGQAAAAYTGNWPTASDATNAPWYTTTDLTTTNPADQFTTGNKWFSDLAKAQAASGSADATLNKDTTTPLFFKHNGVIWQWTQTKGTGDDAPITISLSSHSTTVPNIFKGTKKVEGNSAGLSPKDTAYTFKTWGAPADASKPAENTGVSFTFKVTA